MKSQKAKSPKKTQKHKLSRWSCEEPTQLTGINIFGIFKLVLIEILPLDVSRREGPGTEEGRLPPGEDLKDTWPRETILPKHLSTCTTENYYQNGSLKTPSENPCMRTTKIKHFNPIMTPSSKHIIFIPNESHYDQIVKTSITYNILCSRRKSSHERPIL